MASKNKSGNKEASVASPTQWSRQNLVMQSSPTLILMPDAKAMEALMTPLQKEETYPERVHYKS